MLEQIAGQLSTVQQMVADGSWFSDGRPSASPPYPAQPPPLTPRQIEVLAYVAQGHTTDWIAARLWLSRATVRNHIARILRALGAHSRLEAVANARQLGLL